MTITAGQSEGIVAMTTLADDEDEDAETFMCADEAVSANLTEHREVPCTRVRYASA